MRQLPLIADPKLKGMDFHDSLPPEWRALVHEYGLVIIKTMIEIGIRSPKQAKHLITMIREHYLYHSVLPTADPNGRERRTKHRRVG